MRDVEWKMGVYISSVRDLLANCDYFTATEGDVERVMDRPVGDGADVQMEREKW